MDIKYDKYGRMNYNPEYHANNGKPWVKEDLKYLATWYDITGPEEMSFALERTIKTVMKQAYKLRKDGQMKEITDKKWHKRLKK